MIGRTTPEKVTELSKCEVFVFGSNLRGEHRGGAARMAHRCFGAEWGIGVGPTGKCYAIPTMHGGVEAIKPYVDEFVEYAKSHPDTRFLVTRIGCGIAGFSDEEMAPLFMDLKDCPNVCFPVDWRIIFETDETIDAVLAGIIPKKRTVDRPKAITEKDLIRLSEEYKYIIGAKVDSAPKPEIRIRYVIERDRFGYADFGDFFFTETGDLYVWTRWKQFDKFHDQAIVESYFNDECKGRGNCRRVIFAGVKTGYRDSNGDEIYTGDVIDLHDDYGNVPLALGTLGENENDWQARYAFVLDNHCVWPEQCRKMTRVGTVFYQLDWKEVPVKISALCYRFQPWWPDGVTDEQRKLMAKFTPNFDQELWKYHALEILEIEFNWRT